MPRIAQRKKFELMRGVAFESPSRRDEIGYYAPALAQATFPTREPKGITAWVKDGGSMQLKLIPGTREDKNGDHVPAFPYGMIPRLTMIWLITEARRTGVRTITLGDFISDFLENIGYDSRSSKNYHNVHKQLTRLFESTLQITYQRDMMTAAQSQLIASSYQLWWTPDDRQASLMPSKVQLSTEFFEAIVNHAYPIDLDIVRGLHGELLAMDLYVWLAYRVNYANQKDAPILVPWNGLALQFGSYSSVKDFKKHARKALKAVKAFWPRLQIDIDDPRSLAIRPSDLTVRALLPQKPAPLEGLQ